MTILRTDLTRPRNVRQMLISADGQEWPDIKPRPGPQSGWHAKKFVRIGRAGIADGSRTSLYGIYGIRNDGAEVFTQYEGYKEGSVITGRPMVISDCDSDPYTWSPVTWFSMLTIFGDVVRNVQAGAY
jgi:hypothetical protein